MKQATTGCCATAQPAGRLSVSVRRASRDAKLCQASEGATVTDIRCNDQFEHIHPRELDLMVFGFTVCSSRAEVPLLPDDLPKRLPAIAGAAQDILLGTLRRVLDEGQPDPA